MRLARRVDDSSLTGQRASGTSEVCRNNLHCQHVAAVNDPPVLSDITMNIDEINPSSHRERFHSHPSDAGFGDNMVNVRIRALPTQGTLKLGPR